VKTSIIVLTYRHERYVREALQSAVGQTLKADEIIIIDDASPDNTPKIAEAFIRENPTFPLRLINNESNLGVTGSFARAVAASSGDVIFTLAGDDVALPTRLKVACDYLSIHPKAFALIANALVIDENSCASGLLDNCAGYRAPSALGVAGIRHGEYFLRGRSSCGATAAYRAEVFRAFSPLRVGLYAEDEPAAFRAMLLGTCDFLPEPLVRWRRHANNLSHGTGSRRGPEMAVHFRKCEAMVDQMLADAGEWVIRNPGISISGFEHAVTSLRFHKAKWSLWAVAHDKGVRLSAFFAAAKDMAGCDPSPSVFLKEAWRPACRMIMPFPLQRVMAKLRSRP
jgi:glycosyltransferase involved in cell wall biosynthesis